MNSSSNYLFSFWQEVKGSDANNWVYVPSVDGDQETVNQNEPTVIQLIIDDSSEPRPDSGENTNITYNNKHRDEVQFRSQEKNHPSWENFADQRRHAASRE